MKDLKKVTSKTKRWNDWDLSDVYYKGIEQGKLSQQQADFEMFEKIIDKLVVIDYYSMSNGKKCPLIRKDVLKALLSKEFKPKEAEE